MTYHVWGDSWFEQYGDQLREAEEFIMTYVNDNSGCYISMKEKYGTLRYEHIIPQMEYTEDNVEIYNTWARIGRDSLLKAVFLAATKWPEIKDELFDDLYGWTDEKDIR